jgi:pimeloyl-ACP methyl ester carboxylesterase
MSATLAHHDYLSALPRGVRSRVVDNNNGLMMHVLEAGFETAGRPCVLLVHGFPELAYSWRKVMLPLAGEGFHVIAPDQRGYGRTSGWTADYDDALDPFRLLNLVRDNLGLIAALGHREVACVVGHDVGSSIAAWGALERPEVFRSLVMMSAPVSSPPKLRFGSAMGNTPRDPAPDLPLEQINDELARLERPRKHYQWYYCSREADPDMRNCAQGIHSFLRAYFHYKSADWKQNRPHRLRAWTARELERMPTYYIMDRDQGMAETVATQMPSSDEISACEWLTEDELAIYASEYARLGFQGGLQWYRCRNTSRFVREQARFSGRNIDVPSMFIAGKSDWGPYQKPGDLEDMQHSFCTRMVACELVDGAGHWVQQEQPEHVQELLLAFLRRGSSS